MERSNKSVQAPARAERQLAHLKIISRLLAHELHAQNAPRVTLSRDQVLEIQTSIDLYIEEVLKSNKTAGSLAGRDLGVQAVAQRVN